MRKQDQGPLMPPALSTARLGVRHPAGSNGGGPYRLKGADLGNRRPIARRPAAGGLRRTGHP